ncbi:MAG TPA: hypothetical protein VN634_02240 [Candidatus Limnocylindrales bacterium]|nr:hypothetical protein [Candidatus Limnocylindrales bacterium]
MVTLRIKTQIYDGDEIAIGPGKADLLTAIAATGSIAGGAREMGMSYRRAWLHVLTMNDLFRTPLVDVVRGGSGRGGATLTLLGTRVLARYRALQAAAEKTAAPHFRKISSEMAARK